VNNVSSRRTALSDDFRSFVSEERRGRQRYPIQRSVRFREPRGVIRGGTSVDLSSGGLSFIAEDPPIRGQSLELALSWPAVRPGGIPLELVVVGRVVRHETYRAALSFTRYEILPVGRGVSLDPSAGGLQAPDIPPIDEPEVLSDDTA
jgi:hypothetical protein